MALFRLIASIFTVWYGPKRRFNRITARGDAETSVSLGVESILMSLITAAFTVVFAWLTVFCFSQIGESSILFATVFAFACPICAALLFLRGTFFGGMFYWIYQLRLNRRAIGYVAIIVWILSMVAAVALSIYFLSGIDF